MFIQAGKNASKVFSEKINDHSLESFLRNAISGLEIPEKDYKSHDSRVLMLTLNHDLEKGECDGIGVINISWDIYIKNYKRKTKKGGDYHDTKIGILCRGVFYSDPAVLVGDYNVVKVNMKDELYYLSEPVNDISIKLFNSLPEANQATFKQGIPSAITDEYVDSLIPYESSFNFENNSEQKIDLTDFPVSNIKGMETIRGIYKKSWKEGTLFGFSVCTEIKVLLGILA